MTAAGSDSDSDDYGWDLSLEEDVYQLLSAALPEAVTASPSNTPLRPVPVAASLIHHEASSPLRRAAVVPVPVPVPVPVVEAPAASQPGLDDLEVSDVSYPDLSRALASLDNVQPRATPRALPASPAPAAPTATNSPLARFRTYPRKPLSVSDLTSGAWCELQYEYTLTRLPGGRRTRTPAMRAGTKVHARLEEEVHTTVRVDVASKEDMHGLKLWNMVQGLRTLRETGLTRELEIWGVVDRQVVSGVIDALSYNSPDPEFEAKLAENPPAQSTRDNTPSKTGQKTSKGTGAAAVSNSRITDFFASPSSGRPLPAHKIYITDIKTRGSRKLPSGVAVRPTKIQLFLYHRFVSDLAAGQLDFLHVFRRYALDPDASFSDAFLAQIGLLHDEIFTQESSTAVPSSPIVGPSVDNSDTIPGEPSQPGEIRYRTLRSLAQLVRSEVALTFPQGAESVGRLVAAEYRLRPAKRQPRHRMKRRDTGAANGGGGGGKKDAKGGNKIDNDDDDNDYEEHDEDAGRCIGTNVMPVDADVLDRYLAKYLEWWRGERAANGVDIEEAALKCGYCEFAADCEWRQALDEERVRQVRAKATAKLAAAKPVLF